jgi:hypothetical protein
MSNNIWNPFAFRAFYVINLNITKLLCCNIAGMKVDWVEKEIGLEIVVGVHKT